PSVLLCSAGVHRALPSFPTRRSSDLPYPQSDRLVMLADRNVDGSPMDVAHGTHVEVEARSRTFEALAVARSWQPALAGVGESERDRKSTRLNSSHVKISYAVFCLKKK